jgi:hypothetical protein
LFQPVHPALSPPGDPYIDYGPTLPERTGRDRVVAIARDPETVWAWWETETAATVALRDVERGVIAVRSAGPMGTAFFAAEPDRPYVIEVDGRASNVVRTPRLGPASEIDPQWVPTPAELEVLRLLAVRAESIPRAISYPGQA